MLNVGLVGNVNKYVYLKQNQTQQSNKMRQDKEIIKNKKNKIIYLTFP